MTLPPASQPRRVRIERGIYRNPATGRLEIEYTDEAGRLRWKTVEGGIAKSRRARAVAQRCRRSFADVAEEWLAGQTRLRWRTYEGYERALDRHLLPRLGERAITTIDEDVVVELIAELELEGLAGWTIRGILVPLGRVLAFAVRRKLMPHNPVRRLKRSERPRVNRREMRILRADEIEALLRAAAPAYLPILAMALFTGLRLGELLGLCWGDVDLDARLVHVRRQLDRLGDYTEPKTPRASRTVVLSPSLAALLAEHRRSSAWTAASDPVFATASGRPMHYRNVTRRGLAAAVAAAGLNSGLEPPLRFHDVRHNYAALLIAQDLNVVYVSRQLGHVYPSFTLNTYGGLFERAEHARRASEGLEAAFPAALRAAVGDKHRAATPRPVGGSAVWS